MLYTARFVPQAWINDYAVDVDPQGPQNWDCSAYVWSLPEEETAVFRSGYNVAVLDEHDIIKADPAAPEWVREWTGPFSLFVTYHPTTVDRDRVLSQYDEFDAQRKAVPDSQMIEFTVYETVGVARVTVTEDHET